MKHLPTPLAREQVTKEELAAALGISQEAAEIAIGMIQSCLDHNDCMGMDGGYDYDAVDDYDEDPPKHHFRIELENAFYGISL